MIVSALIPLRGGSKSIPGKNIKSFHGKPLCHWALSAALDSRIFQRIWVSTDDPQIADVCRQVDPGIEILERPSELATDEATTESAMLHASSLLDSPFLCTIQATSPFTRAQDLQHAWQKVRSENLDSLLSGVLVKQFCWTPEGTPMNYDPRLRPRRQDFRGHFVENGAFYFTRREILLETRCRLGGKIGVYAMPPICLHELDEPEDWEILESIAALGAATEPI